MIEQDDGDFVRSGAMANEYRVHHDWSGEASIVGTIVRAVREISGRDPAERLHDRIDPDALDSLFRRSSDGSLRDEGSVTFPFAGFDVTVNANGTIDLK